MKFYHVKHRVLNLFLIVNVHIFLCFCFSQLLTRQYSSWTVKHACDVLLSSTNEHAKSSSLRCKCGKSPVVNLKEVEGLHGRQAVAIENKYSLQSGIIPRGSILLREYPLAVCMNQSTETLQSIDKAGNSSSVLLPAHLQLACRVVCDDSSADEFLHHCRPPTLLQPSIEHLDYTLREKAWLAVLPLMVVMSISASICSLMLTSAATDNASTTLGVRVFNILRRLPHNTHAISTIQSSPVDTSSDSTPVTVVSQRARGIGIFSIASSLNHACDANTVVKFHVCDGNDIIDKSQCYLELVASRDIQPGEELCLSYGPTPVMAAVSRQRILWEQYTFLCQCRLCLNYKKNEQTLDYDEQGDPKQNKLKSFDQKNDGSIAELEKSFIPWVRNVWNNIDNINLRISDEHHTTSPIQLKSYLGSVQQLLNEIESKIKEASAAEIYFGSTLSESCKRHFDNIHHTLTDLMGEICVYLQDYPVALTYAQQGVQLYMKMYCAEKGLPIDDILVSREEVKVIQLLQACGKTKECVTLAEKVLRNMKPYVDVHRDPDYLDVQYIVESLQQSTRLV